MYKFLIYLFLLSVTLSCVEARQDIEYHIDINQPVHHLAKVTIKFPAHTESMLEIKMPVWRSGYYHILDLSKNVREFSATTLTGEPLEWSMIDKASWQVLSEGKATKITYQIYANNIGRRTSVIDETHAFLDASAVFMYSPTFRDEPLTVSLDVPTEWRSRSGMESVGRHVFRAGNYDILIDSPIETGIHSFHEFSAGERQYEILFWGRGNYDETKIIKDLIKLDAEVEKVWGAFPYSRYLYMVHATSGPRGATEHINSTIIQRQRDKFASREDYIDFMTTAAHELVHTWNVKAYRPEGLVPYDFQKENYTTLLWVAEGTTSYFDTLLTRRAGIMTQDEFHKDLAKGIERYLNRPGREVQSISEASFYNWIESTNDFTINHSVNIYRKGSLVSWLLDFEIQRATAGEKSLEDVHRRLYELYPLPGKGYSEKDFLTIVNELTDKDFSNFWESHIAGTEKIDFSLLLDFVGLQIERKTSDKQTIDLGLSYDDSLKVTRVRKGSAAWEAGLTIDDVLISFDGMRLTNKNIEQRLDALKVDSEVNIHFFRRDELFELSVDVEKNENKNLNVVVNKDASEEQQKRYKDWTGHDLIEKDDKKETQTNE
ncbi:M61 family metallopeptidase [Pleionea sediminis]|uniref:M61 family metallopeptidase n=1 Tax=Pleionea sediminis TaxID=2569479 RepID=UPI001185637C|nr:PDZ domain-containing protein [Pleionea sediminis]